MSRSDHAPRGPLPHVPRVDTANCRSNDHQRRLLLREMETRHSLGNHLSLAEASYLCNKEIVSRCQQLICFAFHDSGTLLQTCKEAEEQRKVVTLFYFD